MRAEGIAWSKSVAGWWHQGIASGQAGVVLGTLGPEFLARAQEALGRIAVEEPILRPSGGTTCGRLTWALVNAGVILPREPMPATIGATFAHGHWTEALALAGILAGLPEGVNAELRLEVELPSWFPGTRTGHPDLVLSGPGGRILADIKGMSTWALRAHRVQDYSDLSYPDSFGYLSQLALYAVSLGLLDQGALLVGMNRDRPAAGLVPRFIEPARLRAQLDRLQAQVARGTDPGPELLKSYGDRAWMYCGVGGSRKGYCPIRAWCARHPDGVQ